MARLARWCFEHRWRVLAVWLLALVAVAGVSNGRRHQLQHRPQPARHRLAGRSHPAGHQLPGRVGRGRPGRDPGHARGRHPVRPGPGRGHRGAGQGGRGARGGERGQPLRPGRGRADQPVRHRGLRPGDLGPAPAQITAADAKNLISAAESADGADVHVSLGGPAITNSERAGLGRSLGVGIAAALAILLIVFGGALLASLLPLAHRAAGAGHRRVADRPAQPRCSPSPACPPSWPS